MSFLDVIAFLDVSIATFGRLDAEAPPWGHTYYVPAGGRGGGLQAVAPAITPGTELDPRENLPCDEDKECGDIEDMYMDDMEEGDMNCDVMPDIPDIWG